MIIRYKPYILTEAQTVELSNKKMRMSRSITAVDFNIDLSKVMYVKDVQLIDVKRSDNYMFAIYSVEFIHEDYDPEITFAQFAVVKVPILRSNGAVVTNQDDDDIEDDEYDYDDDYDYDDEYDYDEQERNVPEWDPSQVDLEDVILKTYLRGAIMVWINAAINSTSKTTISTVVSRGVTVESKLKLFRTTKIDEYRSYIYIDDPNAPADYRIITEQDEMDKVSLDELARDIKIDEVPIRYSPKIRIKR